MADLEEVDLHEVALQRDGPRLQLRFDLPRFPDHPPARWHADANAVQVTVDFWMIEELIVNGWGTTNTGVLTLRPSSDGLRVSFAASGASLSCRCSVARIVRVSEYTIEEPDPDADDDAND